MSVSSDNWVERAGAQTELRDMTTCVKCACDRVTVVDFEPRGKEHWYVELRCPDCGWVKTDIYTQTECDIFDVEIDEQRQRIESDAEELGLLRLKEHDVPTFARALELDLITADDFA